MIVQFLALTSLATPSGALINVPCSVRVSSARPPVNSTVIIVVKAHWNYHVFMTAKAKVTIAEHSENATAADTATFDLHISPAMKNVPIAIIVSAGIGDYEGRCVTRILPT